MRRHRRRHGHLPGLAAAAARSSTKVGPRAAATAAAARVGAGPTRPRARRGLALSRGAARPVRAPLSGRRASAERDGRAPRPPRRGRGRRIRLASPAAEAASVRRPDGRCRSALPDAGRAGRAGARGRRARPTAPSRSSAGCTAEASRRSDDDVERAARRCATRWRPRRRCARWRSTSSRRRRDGTRKLRFRPRRPRHRVGADPRREPDEPLGTGVAAGRLLRDKLTLCVSSQVGCALDCALLRDRDAGLRPPPHGGRDRRAGLPRDAASPAAARPTWSSWAWASRMHNFDSVARALGAAAAPVGRGVLAAADHRLDGRASCPGIEKLGQLIAGAQPGHLAERHHRRGARPASCRSTALADRRAARRRARASRCRTAGA